MLHFIGIDLAWSLRNPTGGAVIGGDARGGAVLDTRLLAGDDEILDYVARYAGDGPAIVAVDAPLHVPNEAGQRPGEAELARAFGRYQAGAHPANRRLLERYGGVRGERLVERLAERGFTHQSTIAAGEPVRQVIEVFPHPAMVALFGLARTLKYKAKPNRSRAQIEEAWRAYQQHLRDLAHADPPLREQDELLAQDVGLLRGKALKSYEDRIDALMCAYIALYAFRWGDARCKAFGTLRDGYIYTPLPAEMIER